MKPSPKLVGSVTTFDGADMNLSLMPSEVEIDGLVVAVSIEREEAVVNKSLMPSGGNDEELVLGVAAERDEAAMIVSVEVAVGEMLHSIWSLIAPVMTYEASPSRRCLPVVISRGS